MCLPRWRDDNDEMKVVVPCQPCQNGNFRIFQQQGLLLEKWRMSADKWEKTFSRVVDAWKIKRMKSNFKAWNLGQNNDFTSMVLFVSRHSRNKDEKWFLFLLFEPLFNKVDLATSATIHNWLETSESWNINKITISSQVERNLCKLSHKNPRQKTLMILSHLSKLLQTYLSISQHLAIVDIFRVYFKKSRITRFSTPQELQ